MSSGEPADDTTVASPAPDLDGDLVRVAAGDREAFARLYDALAPAVYGLGLRVLASTALAEEAAQDTFADVWRLASRYDPALGGARAWVLTQAHSRAVDRVRREQSQRDRAAKAGALEPEALQDVADAVVDAMTATWNAARVRRALAALTPIQREAIELAYFEGCTHTEVSARLAVPLGTAKTRIRDGLIRLRDALGVEA